MAMKCRVMPTVIVMMLALPAAIVFAQSERGSIQGRVTDSSNAVLQGASVTVTPGGMRAVTNTEGEYAIAGLAPGSYTVTVNFVGFKEFVRTVTVSSGQAWSSGSSTSRRSPSASGGTRAAKESGAFGGRPAWQTARHQRLLRLCVR
jgi:hypothetical protein